MNKKGMTLLEVLVSLALIASFMAILMNLLASLKGEDAIANAKTDDSVVRTEIINRIETDLVDAQLTYISYDKINHKLEFEYGTSSQKTIQFTKTTAVYEEKNGDNIISSEKWELQHSSFSIDNMQFNICRKEQYFYMKILVPVKNNTSKNYDILLSFTGDNAGSIKYSDEINESTNAAIIKYIPTC